MSEKKDDRDANNFMIGVGYGRLGCDRSKDGDLVTNAKKSKARVMQRICWDWEDRKSRIRIMRTLCIQMSVCVEDLHTHSEQSSDALMIVIEFWFS